MSPAACATGLASKDSFAVRELLGAAPRCEMHRRHESAHVQRTGFLGHPAEAPRYPHLTIPFRTPRRPEQEPDPFVHGHPVTPSQSTVQNSAPRVIDYSIHSTGSARLRFHLSFDNPPNARGGRGGSPGGSPEAAMSLPARMPGPATRPAPALRRTMPRSGGRSRRTGRAGCSPAARGPAPGRRA